MTKIYTLTLNSALDRILHVPEIKFHYTNRTDQVYVGDGGKGTHVSHTLTKLKQNNTAIAVLGGFAGSRLESIILDQGINLMKFSVKTETRVCTSIFDSKNQSIKVNEKGETMSPIDCQRLDSFLENLFGENQIWVLSGSLPQGVSKDYYAKLITKIQSFDNSKVFLDTSGEALRLGLEAKPFLVKPNDEEMESLVGYPIDSVATGVKAIEEIHAKYQIENIGLSLGKMGLLLGSKSEVIHTPIHEVKTVKTIGAGDGLLGGIVYGFTKNLSLSQIGAIGVAIGSISTSYVETTYPEYPEVEAILPQIISSQKKLK
jgi:tagatose 6-phosphate kinase